MSKLKTPAYAKATAGRQNCNLKLKTLILVGWMGVSGLVVPEVVKAQIFGSINAPPGVSRYGSATGGGLVNFGSNILKLMIVVAGIYALFNIVLAGYGFLGAGDDSNKIAAAWAKIWQSVLGLAIAAGAGGLAMIFSWLIFGNALTIIQPQIYGP